MNGVVLVTDSMRADHLGCHPLCVSHHGRRVETPHLDALAAEGTLFEEAYGGSLPTIPMRADAWSGRYGTPFHGWQPFDPQQCLLAECLWSQGFTSALFTDVYHMHKPGFNCGRGFDTTVFIRGQEYDPWQVDEAAPVDLDRWHRLKHGEERATSDEFWRERFEQYLRNRSTFAGGDDCFTARVMKEAIRWLERTVETRGIRDGLFLWIDCFDPHEPWDPPEPWWSMYAPERGTVQDLIDPVPGPPEGYLTDEEIARVFSLYAGEVTMVDHWAGVLFDVLRELDLMDNTVVTHISDHGEPFNEHGIVRKARPWLYEELTHIPWTIRHPEIGGGRRSDAFVQPPDLMPTLLDFLGAEPPEGADFHGVSLRPLMQGKTDAVREFACSGMGPQWAIRTREWSLLLPIRQAANAARTGRPELYDRRNDLYEQNNLIDEHPDVAEDLERQLRQWAAEKT